MTVGRGRVRVRWFSCGRIGWLSPLVLQDELWHLDPTDPHWDDPDGPQLPDDTDDTDEPDDLYEPYAHTTRHPSTSWTLDLDDPYPWLEPALRPAPR